MPLVTQESGGYAWIPNTCIMRFIYGHILIETATNSLKAFTTGTCVFALGSFWKLNTYMHAETQNNFRSCLYVAERLAKEY